MFISARIKDSRSGGFTLTELLVVIVTLAVLVAVVLPAIAGTKPNSQVFQCLENQRQIVRGWQMYAEDNGDLLPPNDYPRTMSYAASSTAAQASLKNWVVGTIEQSADAIDLPALEGKLSELLDPNTLLSEFLTVKAVYHCPADTYMDPNAGNRVHVRSYSMNSAVGTIGNTYYVSGSPAPGTPVQGGWLNGSTYNAGQTVWRTYGKITSFNKPGPAKTFITMEENPYTINDGSIALSANAWPAQTYLIDFPAANHEGGANISFADGHVTPHKWLDARTYTPEIGRAHV